MISQGDVFWLDHARSRGSASELVHPFVVIQGDEFNHSRIATTVVCLITSSLKRAHSPGNVLLEPGEANLDKRSVVNVSQIASVDKEELVEKIGSLSEARLREVLSGVDRVLAPRRFAYPNRES